jgi:hypothetical protein
MWEDAAVPVRLKCCRPSQSRKSFDWAGNASRPWPSGMAAYGSRNWSRNSSTPMESAMRTIAAEAPDRCSPPHPLPFGSLSTSGTAAWQMSSLGLVPIMSSCP